MSDIIRVGYISNVNYAEGTAQVVYKDRDNAVSPYLPFASNEYDPPETDTLVYVVHLPSLPFPDSGRNKCFTDFDHGIFKILKHC